MLIVAFDIYILDWIEKNINNFKCYKNDSVKKFSRISELLRSTIIEFEVLINSIEDDFF